MIRYLFYTIATVTALIICACTGSENSANTNHLINEKSPYLLQHAHNPVDWYPWGNEALEKAEKENKLLIISIGYASCHWCHVMEKESFSDTAVSRLMNEHFVSIKVDREERPDVDNVYLTACQIASGEGCGWPLNAIALPNGKPVYAGTYYPKAEWMRLLNYFIEMHANEPEKMAGFADQLTQGIQQNEIRQLTESDSDWNVSSLDSIATVFMQQIDLQTGGKRGAPKFPLPNNFEFLLQYSRITGDTVALRGVTTTLDGMLRGGIYDQIGGGFARYSTDSKWHVPHFEKMLYDNAQLISLYSKAYKLTGTADYRRVIEETIAFAERELRDTSGGFYSSIDADSEGEEGSFYVWTVEEIEKALDDGQLKDIALDMYDILPEGNWEKGKNVLQINEDLQAIASKHNLNLEEATGLVKELKQKLFQERSSRERPSTDDKILTSWNALMIKAYLDAYTAIGDAGYLEKALEIEAFVSRSMKKEDGSLFRTYKDGASGINAFLEDYAQMIDAYAHLYQTTFNEDHLDEAVRLIEYTLEKFESENGYFLFTSTDDPPLIAQNTEVSDNVIPASNSVMARNLYAVGTLKANDGWIEKSKKMLAGMFPEIRVSNYPSYYSNWLQLLTNVIYPYYEIAIVGQDAIEMNLAMQISYDPFCLYLGGKNEGTLELLEDKLREGETYIYVCRNKVCKLPVKEPSKARNLLTVSM